MLNYVTNKLYVCVYIYIYICQDQYLDLFIIIFNLPLKNIYGFTTSCFIRLQSNKYHDLGRGDVFRGFMYEIMGLVFFGVV